jgi:hypothetical protein
MPAVTSPRRQSRLRPHLVNVERAVQSRDGATVNEAFEAVLLSEPASIQVRTRTTVVEELGLVMKRTFVAFFDTPVDVQIGDHVIYNGAAFLVTDTSLKPSFIDAKLEQLVTA